MALEWLEGLCKLKRKIYLVWIEISLWPNNILISDDKTALIHADFTKEVRK
jgi:hypothetical protein